MDTRYDQLPTLSQEPPVTPPAAPILQQTPPAGSEPPPTVLSTPPVSDPPPPPKGPALRINKKLLLIIGALVLVIVVVVLIFMFGSRNKASQVASDEKQIEAKYKGKDKSADNDYMAKALLTWLDKTRLSDGRFAFSQLCTSASDCKLQAADNRLGPQVAWGEFMYYQKHPSAALLTQINKDIAAYVDESVVPTVQNNFYNCKFMYQLWQSNVFTLDQKNNIQTLCTRSQQPPPPPPPAPGVSATITDADIAPLMQGIENNHTASEAAINTTVPAFASVVVGVSDLVTESTWLSNENLYQLALVYFKESLTEYTQSPTTFRDASSLLGVAALDLYKKTGKSAYLTFAENMFLKNSNEDCSSLGSCINSIFLAKSLAAVTGNKDYQYFVDGALRHVGQTGFDSNGFGGYQIGNKAFYSPGSHTVYPVLENSLLLGIYEAR